MDAPAESLPLASRLVAAAPATSAAPRTSVAARRWQRWLPVTSLLASVGLTAVCSLLIHGEVRPDMLATGFVCALVVERVVARVTRHYRRRLAAANALLEQRVAERTADLAVANAELRAAANVEDQLRAELLTRDRLVSLGMLASGVAHELRSPLTVITAGVQDLEETLAASGDAELREVLADVGEAARQVGNIARDLSSLSRPGGEAREAIELGPVVAAARRFAGYQLVSNATLVVGPVTSTPVLGNRARLVQVVVNLAQNAIRATRSDTDNTITFSASDRGDAVVLTVADTGAGMSDEVQARLFEPFFTTRADQGGTGLGLSICRTILDRMGATIAVRSRPGEGTTVEVALVAAGDQKRPSSSQRSPASEVKDARIASPSTS